MVSRRMPWCRWPAADAPELRSIVLALRLEWTQQGLDVTRRQRQDYAARVGRLFQPAVDLSLLAGWIDQLRAGLSGTRQTEGGPTVSDLTDEDQGSAAREHRDSHTWAEWSDGCRSKSR